MKARDKSDNEFAQMLPPEQGQARSQPQVGCPGSNTADHLIAKFDANLPP